MRILWVSIWWKFTSSYAVVTRAMLPRLAGLVGRDNVALAAIGAFADAPYMDEWLRVFPLGANMPAGRPTDAAEIASRAAGFDPDIVIFLFEARTCPGLPAAFPRARVIYWMAIDVSPLAATDLAAVEGSQPVAMSRFGLDQLQRAGVQNAAYVPLGIDPQAFRVLDIPQELGQLRTWLVGPGCKHLTVIVAANYPVFVGGGDRKHFQGMLASWAEFAADKPGARLYCHTNPRQLAEEELGTPDLDALADALGIRDRVFFPPSGISLGAGYPAEFMPMLYNAADVLLATTAGEGFGLPIVEAQASGVPVVCTDWTAMPELVRWGQAVKPAGRQWYMPQKSWWAWPDVHGGAQALQGLYDEWQAAGGRWPLERRRAVSAAIHREYSWDYVVREMWAPLVRGLASRDSVAISQAVLGG